MNNYTVAIVGRPNVGKSTLFNRFIGGRKAIVEGEPNVTRDRIYGKAEWQGRVFNVIDTGGIVPREADIIKNKIKYQAELAMEEADVILYVVDGRTGITTIDQEIAQILYRTNKEVILVVNKVEDFSRQEEISWEFYSLGFGDPVLISAEHGKNTGELLEIICDKLPREERVDTEDDIINVSIIGKPNVGKSSLVNYLVGKERVIVSDIPGTTRDAVDTLIEWKDIKFNLIDTAGLRKKSRVKESIEYYSNLRALNSVDRADAVLMVIDAQKGITEQDKKIAGYAHDEGKAIVIAVNKWDLIEKENKTIVRYTDEIYYQMKFLNYVPITYISALTGERIEEMLSLLEYVVDQSNLRIKTGVLNEVINEAVQLREPPSHKGKRLKLYYASQVDIKPPTFVFFVNNPELMHFAYQRYLENVLREAFGYVGNPLKFKLKQRK
ncbi:MULTISPECIES: ribosome biogenesis GTPase Der [unclassified Halanaerobium]|uniref:ribosome biogenesis GTPase Der n=1 Tax=unclassified Halanaerobium TaxID=2641197 RepID=UPI000DF4B748|nr:MULTISPECIES: ribosome biogenesis GTPase Der [unclassified Halanaerobium]RCW51460.1 GTP-binding protein [Halanaerobium sp. MA284_MarDTE_T2]RCW89248.1 GTP-binding protein [Halanaerobium sp. DL-01]